MTANGHKVTEGAEQKVLVVDDEPHILAAIQDLLEEDFSVLTMTDAETALHLLEEQEVAVILSDQRMPGFTGDQFLREAQKRSQATRVLFTGYADLQALIKAVNEGKIYGYMAKPWEPEELKSLVFKAADYFRLMRELEHERSLLRALMDHTPDAIYFKDADFRFTRVNKTQASLLGAADPAAAAGKTEADFCSAAYAREADADERAISASGQPLMDKTERIEQPDGQVRWFSTTKAPIREREGRIVGTIGISRDITPRKQTEEALREGQEQLAARERHLRTIIEAGPECVKLLAADGRLLEMNPAGLAMVEADSLEQVVGQSAYAFIAPDYRAAFQALTEDAFAGKEGRLEFELIGLKGTKRWLDTHMVPLRNRQDEIVAALGLTRDVTERKRLEQQLLQAQKMEAVGGLAGGIAHDFNNMLTAVMGFAELALHKEGVPPQVRECLLEISKQGERAAGLIAQLLAFSRRAVTEKQPLELRTFIKEIMKMLERTVPETISVQLKAPGKVALVKADLTQIQQVVLNLCINASHAMPHGGKILLGLEEVALDASYCQQYPYATPGQYVCLSVQDTGIGMTPEVQARIFEPFFTTKGGGEGTGLGLATVYGIVKSHEGHINVHSEAGHGSEFRVYLPVMESGVPRPAEQAQEAPAGGSEAILLVEDQEAVLSVGRKMLEALGYRLLTAVDGVEAFKVYCAHQHEIDLVVADIVMPKMSGQELYEVLSQVNPQVRMLLMSGYSNLGEDVAELRKKGVKGFIQKPFNFTKLGRAVRQALDEEGQPASGAR